MAGEPFMKASYLQDSLKSLEYLGLALKSKVLARIPQSTLREIEESVRGTWLPVELDVIVTEAAAEELGNDGVQDWSAEAMVRSAQGPIIGPFFKTIIALWEPTPKKLYKYAPKAFRSMYRNCGELSVKQVGPETERLTFSGLPFQIINSLPYLRSIAGALEGVIRLCRMNGTVTIEKEAMIPNRREFVASWNPLRRS